MRIAHISDLHLRHHLPGTATISSRRSRLMPDCFAVALEQIRTLQPDLLVITGDLLDYPLDALDDPHTRDQGQQDLSLIAGLLRDMNCPLALVHGNHDHPQLVRDQFRHIPSDQVVAGYRVIGFDDSEGNDNVPERVGSERQRFLSAVSSTGSLPQIHVQHYLVWPELNEDYPHTYGDGASMREQIVGNGNVRLVLSGHYHRGVPLLREQGSYFATVPAFCEAPHPFWVYEIHGEDVVAHQYTVAC